MMYDLLNILNKHKYLYNTMIKTCYLQFEYYISIFYRSKTEDNDIQGNIRN